MTDDERIRCSWAQGNEAMVRYHDTEWGVPTHDERELFELLILEGAQAGLSWRTVLDRREGYRRAFADWDVEAVAGFGDAETSALLEDPGIIRNRAKVRSAVTNAQAWLALVGEEGGFGPWLWSFVEGTPVVNHWGAPGQVPATSPVGDAVSKALKKRGFSFVGPTIMYAYLQSTGLVNDHLTTCFRHRELA